ncbi:hypothetical protein [Yanshouia hominis]|uniref:Uncharacterized protein n=1 Tax=Yanshouia hominis TaxID=2763673 RepID=A0ABR7NN36_9FIRM|nr:hypothetical protein [Yanshouia hominis]MBC8577834.1 hypothetical protein [Yanshouia hominis]
MDGSLYNDFEYYPGARGENFRVSVYNAGMLGSAVSWDDRYTPVKTDENAETATCRVRYQNGGASGTTEYNDGVLTYDIGLLRYIGVELVGGALEESALQELAESIALSR